ncbi:MAG: DNA-methyltransferase, partial [Planctomycetota bacterium]
RFFINDTMNFGQWKLKGHAESDFWQWVNSWGISFRAPSDLGFEDNGFQLPALDIRQEILLADPELADPETLFLTPDLSATSIHRTMRKTAPARARHVAQLIADESPSEPWVIWCHTNYEADALRAAIPEATDLRGSESQDVKEKKLLGFLDGKITRLITKPDIAGFGMNWQHCARQAFVGLSYSYERFYQAIRRCWRFGQQRKVRVHVVMTDAEQALYNTVMRKKEMHGDMQKSMYSAQKTLIAGRERRLTFDTNEKVLSGEDWELRLGDACEITGKLSSNSVDFTIFSPPFSSLYIYSDSIRDMGNSDGDEQFFQHFRYLVPELLRVTRPGRLCAIHCKQLVYYKNQRGSAGLRDFRGDIIRAMTELGWDYHSEVCIWKDPVTEMQRTKSHGLLHKQLCKDSTFSRQGLPDYLVIFRRWAGEEEEGLVSPVCADTDRRRFSEFVGEGRPPTDPKDEPRAFSIEVWQRYASPVWFDISQTNVLNIRAAREDKDEKHICPLQLDVIERAIHLWSNSGDLVFSPFAGIGSEGYAALKLRRRFLGIELKEAYFEQAARNIQVMADIERQQMSIFDF